jgi:hypothetical protein
MKLSDVFAKKRVVKSSQLPQPAGQSGPSRGGGAASALSQNGGELIGLGFFLIVIAVFFNERKQVFFEVLPFLGVFMIMLGITIKAYDYLRRRARSSETGVIQHQPSSIQSQIDRFPRMELDDADREKIRDRVVAEITQDTVKLIAEEWDRKLRPKVQEDRHIESIRSIAGEMQERLSEEIDALGRRSNLNLVIGFFISMSGLVILGWFVFTTTSELSSGIAAVDIIAIRFSIRLSLVAFITVFAYFFLRLYRYGIFEIKYFQNEITGAQFRLISLEAALRTNEKKTIEKISAEMAHTERNFILKKGETTIGLKRDEQEKSQDAALLSALEKLLKQTASKSA